MLTCGLIVGLLTLGAGPRAEPPRSDVSLVFLVTVPPGTPAGAEVCLAGNLPVLGEWSPDGIRFARRKDGTYACRVKVPAGSLLEFKITLGTWETVEKGKNGEELANRKWTAVEDVQIPVLVARWESTQLERRRSTLSGTIRFHEAFPSQALGNARTIAVYMPPDYDQQPDRRYPVLYMQDGQNVFDAATSAVGLEWQADETAERLIAAGAIEPLLIVGIANTPSRHDEYTATVDAAHKHGGDVARYARFVAEEVKPFIDKTYRTQTESSATGVAGSSLGALASLEIARRYPDSFGRIALISPSLWWDQEQPLRALEQDAAWFKGKRIWLDCEATVPPEPESGHTRRARRLAAIFRGAGLVEGRDLVFREYPGEDHNERTWGTHFDEVLRFLYPVSP
jgi:predicted alpha/beta superfamily hydrolase